MTDQLLAQLRELHHDAPKMRCGARKTETVEHYSGRTSTQILVCTLDAGHDGDEHRDGICCWRLHRFTGAEPMPEDVWRGQCCSCGALNCKTRALLDAAGVPG